MEQQGFMAHNRDGIPPWDYGDLLDALNPRKGLCYFIERKSDQLWLHKSTECFTNNEKEALCYSGEKGKQYATEYLETIKAWIKDECTVVEHQFPEPQEK